MRDDVSWLGSSVFQRPDLPFAVTPTTEIRNVAKLGTAIDAGFHVAVRKDVVEAFRAKREAAAAAAADEITTEHRRELLARARARGDDAETIRDAWPSIWPRTEAGTRRWDADSKAVNRAAKAQEAKMAMESKDVTEARRERLREYLREHGETARKTLVGALGYDKGRSPRAAIQQLDGDCTAIGAGPTRRHGRTIVLGESMPIEQQPRRKSRTTPEPEPSTISPVRPSLAEAARDALRQADREGAPLYLEAEFASALHGRLVEAGL